MTFLSLYLGRWAQLIVVQILRRRPDENKDAFATRVRNRMPQLYGSLLVPEIVQCKAFIVRWLMAYHLQLQWEPDRKTEAASDHARWGKAFLDQWNERLVMVDEHASNLSHFDIAWKNIVEQYRNIAARRRGLKPVEHYDPLLGMYRSAILAKEDIVDGVCSV